MGGTKYLKMPTDFFENEAIDFLLSGCNDWIELEPKEDRKSVV